MTNVATTHYVIGSAVGPAPYPSLVRDLQRVIGDEARAQVLEAEGRLPAPRDRVRRGRLERDRHLRRRSSMTPSVALVGVEAGGEGLGSAATARSLAAGAPGVLHGSSRQCSQDEDGQIARGALGLGGARLPGLRPEHAALRDERRVTLRTP